MLKPQVESPIVGLTTITDKKKAEDAFIFVKLYTLPKAGNIVTQDLLSSEISKCELSPPGSLYHPRKSCYGEAHVTEAFLQDPEVGLVVTNQVLEELIGQAKAANLRGSQEK